MKVLIIHRQKTLLQKLKEKFISGGWHVHASDNGLDGLLTARHYPFDLVLCGFNLPVVSGTEIVRTIRMLSQNTKTPVFFIKSEEDTSSLIELVPQLEARIVDETDFSDSYQVAWLGGPASALN
jgi:DNA-binding response OmpR family regulator